jgi:hypothetical protein
MSKSFNPVKDDTSGVKARRMIWSSTSLDLALKGIEQGKKLIANPFYENNTKLLKGDLVFERTQEEINEWKRCKNDIIYFVEKYCQLMTPEGIKHVKLRDYQKKYLKHLEDNRLSIYLACRQCAKTTTSAVFMLHYILFNTDKNALVLGNKRKTAVEILDKAKKIYVELPYFLRPGIYKWNEAEIVLDNGCRLMAEATTINSGISFTFHCVLADEFAHISPTILDKFYNNLFPVVTAGKARFMITSTQNGYNLFYRLYMAAAAGDNEYKAFKTDWWEVPEWNPDKKCWEKRDEKWHKLQVANYGSEEAFNKQFGTSFDVSANTLINNKKLDKFKQNVRIFENKDLWGIPNFDKFFWDPSFNPMEDLKKYHIIITCDLAEGIEGDYTIFSFYKLINDCGTIKLVNIGYFRSNSVPREECSLALQLLICKYMDFNKTLLSYERNTYGDLFKRDLLENAEKNKEISNIFDESILVRYYNDSGTKYDHGIKLTRGNKTTHCLLFKESFERGFIENQDEKFVNELASFTDDGTGHYKASYGHDDMVMAAVQLEFVKNTLQYKIMEGDLDSNMNDIIIINDNIYNPFETYYDYYNMDEYDTQNNSNRLINM